MWLQAEPGHGGHRRAAGPPAVPGRLPVSRHAGLLAGRGCQGIPKRGLPPPGAVRGHRPGGGLRRQALPVGAGDETGGQHEPGAARHHPQPPRGLPGPLVPGARGASQRRGEPPGGAFRPGGSGRRRGLAGRGQRPRPDPGAARPAGAGEPGSPGARDPLYRVRAPRRAAAPGGGEAGTLPADGVGGAVPCPCPCPCPC